MDRRISFLKNWLKTNLDTKYTVSELAGMVELSNSQLHERFKSETGKTPKEYLYELRMKNATKLLETTFKSVKEICYEVGFSDPRNFARDFRKKYGKSPTEYSNNYAEKVEKEKVNDPKP